MSVFMYVIREFYDAIDDCKMECMNCNDDPVHAWDEGVAFYTGSTENYLLYTLANKRCQNYNTCGPDGDEIEGIAKINYDLMIEFSAGQFNLLSGNCNAARENAFRISQLMYVPLVQGALRYAYKVDRQGGQEKEKAEGASFAAAVLPVLHDCSPEAAQIVYDNMGVGATSTSYMDVRSAFEENYQCMGISCDEVGGLYSQSLSDYELDGQACVDPEVSSSSSSSESGVTDLMAIAVGVPVAVIAVLAVLCIFYMMNREKAGNPVFTPPKETPGVSYS